MTLRTDDLSAVAGPKSGFGSNFLNNDMLAGVPGRQSTWVELGEEVAAFAPTSWTRVFF